MPEDFISLVEHEWLGLDALSPPDAMAPGYLQTANNCIVDGAVNGRGGALRSRPGVRGQLTTELGTALPLYGAFVYRQNNGTQSLIFAAGTAAAGKIYKWDKGTLGATALTALGSFTASAVQFSRLNDYLVITGNVDTVLRRLNLASGAITAETMAGLTQPQYTANAIATSRLINLLNLTGSWHADTTAGVTASLTLLDPNFTGANLTGQSSGSFLSTSAWMVYGGTVEAHANGGNVIDGNSATSTRYVLMDDNPGGIHAWVKMTASLKANATGIGSVNRRAVHYRVGFTYRSAFVNDAVDVTLVIYDSTVSEIARQTLRVSSTNTGAALLQNLLFSFGSVDDTTIGYVSIAFQGTPGNTPGSSGGGTGVGGPYIGLVSIVPIVVPAIGFVSDSGAVQVNKVGDTASVSTSSVIPIGQVRLSYDMGSAVNLSTLQNIAIGFNQYAAYPVSGLRARLGLRDATAGVVRYTNDFQYVTDSNSGITYATTDLSSTTGSLTAARYLDLDFENDASYAVPNTVNLPFIRLGPFSFAGNLTVGGSYTYRFVEATGAASAGTLLTSPAGAPSQAIIASQIRATGEITAAGSTPPTNSGADIDVYRAGGTFLDGLYRKVARFTPTAGTTGTYWAWSTAGGVYVFDDFTPDSQLISSPDFDFILSDHQNPPTACFAVGVYANRLALMAPAGLYISQLQSGIAAGQYYNLAFDAAAPDAPTQGFFTQITGSDGVQSGGNSTRLVNYLSRLWIFFPNSIYEFGGSDGFDFALHRFEADEGKGLIAARAISIFDNKLWFLAPDGLRYIDGYRSERVSMLIDKLLNPAGAFSGSPLNAAAYARSFLVTNAGRILLGAPLPGGSDIGVLYVWDTRGGGLWTSWTLLDANHRAFYNGVTFSSAADTDDLALLGATGQIYLVGPGGAYGDQLDPTATITPVTITVTSRAYDYGNQWLQVQRLSLALEPADVATTASVVITGQYAASNQFTGTYYFPVGETDLARQKIASRVRGRAPVLSLSAAETAALVIRRWEIQASLGRQT